MFTSGRTAWLSHSSVFHSGSKCILPIEWTISAAGFKHMAYDLLPYTFFKSCTDQATSAVLCCHTSMQVGTVMHVDGLITEAKQCEWGVPWPFAFQGSRHHR